MGVARRACAPPPSDRESDHEPDGGCWRRWMRLEATYLTILAVLRGCVYLKKSFLRGSWIPRFWSGGRRSADAVW